MKNKAKTYLQQMKSFYTKKQWLAISAEDRKALRDLARLQQRLSKHYPKNYQPEEYVNWNAEIEYLKSIGEH